MIPPYLTAFLPAAVRARGEGYVAGRRVRIVHADASSVTALVLGSQRYEVTLSAKLDHFGMTCTCPYAAEHSFCKHQWATLRQADAQGKLREPVAAAGLRPEIFASGTATELDGGRHESPGDQPAPASPRRLPVPEWKRKLEAARYQMTGPASPGPAKTAAWPPNRRIAYIIDVAASRHTEGLVVELGTETLLPDGSWSAPSPFRLGAEAWAAIPDPADRQIEQMLLGAGPLHEFAGQTARTSGFVLKGAAFDTTLRLICETGRCRARVEAGEDPTGAVRWDDGPAWQLHLRIQRTSADDYVLSAILRRSGQHMLLAEPRALHSAGVLLARGAFARFDHAGAFPLVLLLRATPQLSISTAELPDLLATLYSLPRLPALELPPNTSLKVSDADPVPCLSITDASTPWKTGVFLLTPTFRYGQTSVALDAPGETLFERQTLTLHRRQKDAETVALDRLVAGGAKVEWDELSDRRRMVISRTKLTSLVAELVRLAWHVEAEGARFRAPGASRASVRSGIDWFELDASVRYGDEDVPLPTLLKALREGQSSVTLGDGSEGLLPVEWLARLKPLAGTGSSFGGVTRFRRSQIGLLDALLSTLPEATADQAFETARAELRNFDRVAPADPPSTFTGTLRDYQREGLGWLGFLRRFGLGGVLADDMGLGKTVQVLALLESLRMEGRKPGWRPSLVVVPRSLVFNWMREAERFTPGLRVIDHSGTGRDVSDITAPNVDVVLTTYGTLRRDAVHLAAIEFEYVILDEAQAIKNAGTASAKAARLLKARNRLALSGTPVENHLRELWSLFEFLNPGMLGASSAFAAVARATLLPNTSGNGSGGVGGAFGRDLLARALRPVILRRTKEQVAPELPERLEQTLEVELEGPQRKFYDAVLERYRQSVLERVDRFGMARSRMHVLEALLRLRQAACHPVLADPTKRALPSAKLDALIPALSEVMEEGHKAVVFSQFTSFLALVEERMQAAGIAYEYLDGQVQDREARVDRFQTDASIPVFLVSLRAGGQGLNLTAADYVFLLDPWWNPAVEAQAIDRTHRIGQTRRVIATRIVARATIEEKILALQASKRALADAILGEDQGVLERIGRAELEALLSG